MVMSSHDSTKTEDRAAAGLDVTVGLDVTTDAWNRAGFLAAARPMFVSCELRDAPAALALFEFHVGELTVGTDAAFDRVLVTMVGLMRKAFRACDIIGRVDESSLALFLGDCTNEALAAVEGMRDVIEAVSPGQGLGLAVGMARRGPGGSLDELLEEARTRADAVREQP